MFGRISRAVALRAKPRRGTACRPSKAAKANPQKSPADFMSAGFHFALWPLLLRYYSSPSSFVLLSEVAGPQFFAQLFSRQQKRRSPICVIF
jgi:hypothetical protein